MNTSFLQCRHILLTLFYGYYCPRITTSYKHNIQHKSCRPTISVHIWMNVGKKEMPKNRSHKSIVFLL